MPSNFPGPQELRYFYTVSGLEHVHRLNIELTTDPSPGALFEDLDVILKNTASQGLETAHATYLALLRAIYTATVDFSRVELWKYAPNSFDATFVAAQDISLAGSGAGTLALSSYAIITYRTGEGGIIRQTFLEGTFGADTLENFPISPAPYSAMADYVISGASMLLGRDTSRPVAKLHFARGQQESVWRKRNRPA